MLAAVIVLAALLVFSLVGCVLLWRSRPKPVEPEVVERFVDRPVVVEREAKPKPRVTLPRRSKTSFDSLVISGVGRSRRRYIFNFNDGSVQQLNRMSDVQAFASKAIEKPKTLADAQARLVAEWLDKQDALAKARKELGL